MSEPSLDEPKEPKRAFFYGTLMHPRILQHIIGNDGSHLRFSPAFLPGYTRHKVKGATYPGIIPLSQSMALANRELAPSEKVVRGTVVEGLTEEDLEYLDDFEDIGSDEYARILVVVHPLAPFHPMSTHCEGEDALIALHSSSIPENQGDLAFGVEVDTYVYLEVENLEAELWSFNEFVKMHAPQWFDYSSRIQS
ncbi:hypothetical protein DFP72DRAFT_892235 [Ephemerocybe angulata]|uniref:Putative gamma-glutamylcyclotransferase n=1 Tax=Ephemerocybe angulata TaxID=980116 RepID=A0A8H6M681_9AGAR|nr:hypothetical protein DFP72DRAFT_892235 [Tulosesus angulatus]